jgi:O-antigen/teichoic acid export membrane protein
MPEGRPSVTARDGARSAATVGAGLILLALSASVFLVVAARATGPEQFAGLAVLWTLVYTVGIGLFLPFEQEVARAVADRATRGDGARPVVTRAAVAAGGLFLVGTAMLAPLSPWMVDTLFDGSWTLALALLLACLGLAAQYLQRGALSGSGAFGAYATQLGVEGVLRLTGCIALLAIGVGVPGPYALLLAAAPLLSVVAVARPFARVSLVPGPPASWRELSSNLGWLLAASLAAQGLANLATVAVKLLADAGERAAAGHFLAGFTVARLPLLVFAAVQAVLLPSLTRNLAEGAHGRFHRQLRLVLCVTAALGAIGVVGAFAIGPEVLRLLFGPEFDLQRTDLAALSLGTAIYMLALVLQPAVIALDRHRVNAVAWVAGLGVFLACLSVPLGTFARVELALVLGSLTVVGALAAPVLRHHADLDDVDPDPDLAASRIGLE